MLLISLWLVHSLKFIDLILKSRESFSTFLKLSVLALPDLITILLPLTLVIAVMTVYSRLQNDNELTVFASCGYHPWALARPALLVGLLGTVLIYFINIFVLHSSFREIRDVEHRLRNALPNIMVKQGIFNAFGPLTIYVQRKKGKHHLEGLLAYSQREGEPAYTIIASEGNLFIKDGKPTLTLRNGNRQMKDREGSLSIVYFEETTIDLAQPAKKTVERPKKPYELSLRELALGTRITTDLSGRQQLVAEAFQRFLSPLYSLVFVSIILAVLFRQKFQRSGMARSMGIGSLCVLAVQLGCLFLNQLGAKQWQALLGSLLLLLGAWAFSWGSLLRQSFGGMGEGRST